MLRLVEDIRFTQSNRATGIIPCGDLNGIVARGIGVSKVKFAIEALQIHRCVSNRLLSTHYFPGEHLAQVRLGNDKGPLLQRGVGIILDYPINVMSSQLIDLGLGL